MTDPNQFQSGLNTMRPYDVPPYNNFVYNGLYSSAGVSQADLTYTGENSLNGSTSQNNYTITGIKGIKPMGSDFFLTGELTGHMAWGQGGTNANDGLSITHSGKLHVDVGIAYDFMALNSFLLEAGIGGQLINTHATTQSGGGNDDLITSTMGSRIKSASWWTGISIPVNNYLVSYKFEMFQSKNEKFKDNKIGAKGASHRIQWLSKIQ